MTQEVFFPFLVEHFRNLLICISSVPVPNTINDYHRVGRIPPFSGKGSWPVSTTLVNQRIWTVIPVSLMLLLVISLSACGQIPPKPEIQLEAEPTKTLQPTITNTSVTPLVTQPRVPSPVTRTPSAADSHKTPSIIASKLNILAHQKELGLIYQCTELSEKSTDVQENLVGSLVLESTKSERDIFLVRLPAKEYISLPSFGQESFYNASVSPDRNRLAYGVYMYDESKKEVFNQTLVVTNAKGEVLQRSDVQEYGNLATWLDNEHVIFTRDEAVQPVLTGLKPQSIVLNPFTGDEKKLPSDFPNFYAGVSPSVDWGFFSTSRAVYEPSLKYVIYPSTEGEPSLETKEFHMQSIALWDLTRKDPIHRLLTINDDYGSVPVWSPDGQDFVVAASGLYNDPSENSWGNDLFRVSITGTTERLTHLSTPQSVGFRNYRWSPDGKYLAFWLSIDPYPGYRLAVLNVTERMIKNYCILGEDPWKGASPAPIWSPDGWYLAVATYPTEANKHTLTVLLDVGEGSAFSIAEDAIPRGWMKADK